jgi:hypothetical protein
VHHNDDKYCVLHGIHIITTFAGEHGIRKCAPTWFCSPKIAKKMNCFWKHNVTSGKWLWGELQNDGNFTFAIAEERGRRKEERDVYFSLFSIFTNV